MIRKRSNRSKFDYPTSMLKSIRAYIQYYDHYALRIKGGLPSYEIRGDQARLSSMRNIHKGERCFIIANGPSLNELDMGYIRNEITIGCNGIYKEFGKWGYNTTYYVTEDIEQTDLRGDEISKLKDSIKFAALHNAYALNLRNNFIYFNAPSRKNMSYYTEPPLYPQFSRDFASIVHLGSTVTYIMLQLAFHLGIRTVYLLGLDHNYGRLPDFFPPGKIQITEDNYEMVKECHFSKNYYSIGDVIGVPDVKRQEAAFELANKVFDSCGRKILNASPGSKLSTFECVTYESIFGE